MNHNRKKNSKSRSSFTVYETLEKRQLLAADIYQPVIDPFALDAVTVQQMVDRANEVDFVPGDLIVAVETGAQPGGPNWSFMTGIVDTEVIGTMMTVPGNNAGTEISLVHMNLGEGTNIFEAMQRLDGFNNVLWSSPNFIQTGDVLDYVPDDPEYPNQYHHDLMDNDIGWDTTLGDPSIIVAVTDDGVELSHEDLNANIWTNSGETPGNGIDDDGNGYVDDVNGWDWANDNNDPNPDTGSHGTHVSGISAAVTDNSTGVAGVSGGSTIMALQFYDYADWTAAMINGAFTYAVDNGAHIINTSYNVNGWVGDPVVTAAYQYIVDNGSLHFNSAGNGSELNPARQAFEQSILVASSTSSDQLSGFTNYGTGIDITAPGSDILSTLTANTYGLNSGTSMAAPNAAGAAALIWSANPGWNNYQVASMLFAGADNIDAQNPGFEGLMGAGRVNTGNSITMSLADPQVAFTTPLPEDQSAVDDLTIDNFSIGFDQLLDPAAANNMANYELISAGPDELLDTADDIVLPLTQTNNYMVGSNFVNFDIDSGPLSYNLYRLTVSSNIQNPFGQSLDGNGDGTGGDDFVSEFLISPPLLGEVAFHRGSYLVEDTVEINVVDANAVEPVMVDITTTGGDAETLTLVAQGGGLYSATINTVTGAVSTGDGELQVALGQELTVEYVDLDDGFGNTQTTTDTATISNIREYVYGGGPVQFSDNTTVIAEIDITDFGRVGDIDVGIDVTHTWDADLDFFLVGPDGTRVELFTDVGGSDDNFIGTILDDEATTSIADGTAPFTGSFRPEGSLASLDGTDIFGTWTLEMTDDAGGDTGTLDAWSLFIDVIPPELGSVAFDANSYLIGDTMEISVVDTNAVAPVMVDVETTGGDMETLTLADQGNGLYTATISSNDDSVMTGDGTLQVALGDVLTVTYIDQDDGSGNMVTLQDTANITNIREYPYSGPPVQFSDNTTVIAEIDITDSGFVADIDVGLDITHTFDADLDFFLISPDGTRVELFTDVGGSGDNFVGTILDDEASTPIVDGTAPFTGSFSPEGNLADFDGLNITGTWTLEMTDDAGADTGQLDAWSLFIDVIPAEAGIVMFDANSYNAGDTVSITVVDSNASAPVTVDVVSTSGDSETVTLTDQGSGVYTASVPSAAGSATPGDGTLQVLPADILTVTYLDDDTGGGNQGTAEDTANIVNVFEFPSNDIPLNIEDNTTFTSELVIDNNGTIADLDVKIDITHTWDADLDVFLIAPDGTRVELFQDVGGSGDNFTGTILDDEATTSITAGTAPFTGSFSPVGNLSDFDGMSMDGTWLLEITDDATGDTGTLNAWSLCIDVIPGPLEADVLGPVQILEGDSGSDTAMFTIALTSPAEETMTVDYTTSVAGLAAPATDGIDFTGVSGTATFNPGDQTFDVPVTVFGDAFLEGDEQFELIISNISTGAIGSDRATTTIANDDAYVLGDLIDFGREDSPVIMDGVGVGDLQYAGEVGLGWLSGANPALAHRPGRGDELTSDAAFVDNGTFVVDMPGAGTYEVTLIVGIVGRGGDPMEYTLEGQSFEVAPGVGPNVEFFHEVEVNDGQLTIDLDGLGLNPRFKLAGLLVEDDGPLLRGDSQNPQESNNSEDQQQPIRRNSAVTPVRPLALGGSLEVSGNEISRSSDSAVNDASEVDNALSGFLAETAEELLF
ncbi:MAG: proprotein convertase P-domain-containing protein [Planctomycetota bacterium]